MLVYLNGQYVPYDSACVHVEDRGYLFGDGIYEMVRAYGGRPFLLKEHLDRLVRSAKELNIALPNTPEEFGQIALTLMEKNGVRDAAIYIQVTRGAAPRSHAFPTKAEPGVLVLVREGKSTDPALRESGIKVITTPDQRWSRCDIKSLNLLANVLAKQKAMEAGAYDAILIKDGIAIEGSSSNFFGVFGGVIVTYPRSHKILAGVTRGFVVDLARKLGYQVREEAIAADRLDWADELFLSGTMTEILPITSVDGRPVGDGRAGPIAKHLHAEFRKVAESGVF